MSKELVVVTWGGIGDLVMCTPTFRALKHQRPNEKLIVYCVDGRHRQVLENNPFIDSLRILAPQLMWRYPYHLFSYLFKPSLVKYYNLTFQLIPPDWYCQKSIKEIVPQIFDIELLPGHKRVELYFTKKEEDKARSLLSPYKNTVLMHVHSRSSANHHWEMKNWVELVRQLPGYNFIQIGNTDEQPVEGAIDWRGKVTLRESMCLMKYTTSFIGIDSLHSHVTNAFDVPGVVLWGDSSPVYWGHDNNINIYKKVHCSPCYYTLWGNDCPYNRKCMKLITVDEVREALVSQVNTRLFAQPAA